MHAHFGCLLEIPSSATLSTAIQCAIHETLEGVRKERKRGILELDVKAEANVGKRASVMQREFARRSEDHKAEKRGDRGQGHSVHHLRVICSTRIQVFLVRVRVAHSGIHNSNVTWTAVFGG